MSGLPTSYTRVEQALAVLRGLTAKARPSVPASFFHRTRPSFASGSVLEALLEERRDSHR